MLDLYYLNLSLKLHYYYTIYTYTHYMINEMKDNVVEKKGSK